MCDARVQFQWNEMNNITTYVKQKNSVVDPTRKKVAADTGTYRDGRRGLLCGTTAWGSGDEDGTRPPLWPLPPGITSSVVSAAAAPCHSQLLSMSMTSWRGRQCLRKAKCKAWKSKSFVHYMREEKKTSSNSVHQWKSKGLSWTIPQSWHVCAVRDLKIKHWADVKALVFQSELYRQTINRKRNDQKTKSLLQYLDPSRLMDCTDVIFVWTWWSVVSCNQQQCMLD